MSSSSSDERSRSLFSFFFAIFLILGLLMGLVAISLVYIGPIVVLASVLAFLLFHYLTWGWWLGRFLRNRAAGDETPPI